jgi:hypothetical protein
MPTPYASPVISAHLKNTYHSTIVKYNKVFDPAAYLAATADSDTVRANFLIDQALALCGHPTYALDVWGNFTQEELAFLEKFVQ